MKGILKKHLQSEFSKNILTLITGTGIAQIIPLIAAPILSRIYSPSEFGKLALYLSVISVLGAIANARYEAAIILPKEKSDRVIVALIALIIPLILAFIVFIVLLFFRHSIAQFLGDITIANWLLLLPFSIIMVGFFNALNYFSTSEKQYKLIAKSTIRKSIGGTIVQVLIGLISTLKGGGLIIGQVSSHFFGNIGLLRNFKKSYIVQNKVTWEEIRDLLIRYKEFPLFSVWGIFLNTLSTNLTNLFISNVYSITTLGFYSYSFRYLSLPSVLIGNSIGQVYMQKAIEEKSRYGTAQQLFIKTLIRLLIIGVPTFTIGYFIVEDAFALIFGENWRLAGIYAQIIIPLIFAKFIVAPLSLNILIYERQKLGLLLHLIILILTIIVFFTSYYLNLEIQIFLKSLTFILVLNYIIQLIIFWKISKNNK